VTFERLCSLGGKSESKNRARELQGNAMARGEQPVIVELLMKSLAGELLVLKSPLLGVRRGSYPLTEA